jgi:hypothetical protein
MPSAFDSEKFIELDRPLVLEISRTSYDLVNWDERERNMKGMMVCTGAGYQKGPGSLGITV